MYGLFILITEKALITYSYVGIMNFDEAVSKIVPSLFTTALILLLKRIHYLSRTTVFCKST